MDEKLQKELAEVKSNLRSTVISSAVQLSLSNTMRDYRTLTGEAIPYMKFGYKSVIDFLVERCADVVELDDRSMNPVVRAKITEQNRHIASLVSKQKITPAKHKGRSLRPQSYNYNVSSQYAAPHHIRYKPARSNLTCHKPQLKQEPSKTHNQTINYDNQQYKQNQQIDSRKQIKQSQENSQFNNNERHANQNQASNQAHNHNRPQVKQTEEIVQTKIHYKDAETQSVGQVSNSLSEQDSGRHSISAYENTFEATKSNLAELLSRYPKGIERMQLLKLYSEMFNTELCYKSMGFSSLVGMCRSLEDVMHVLRPSPYSDLLLMDARLPKPSELELRRQVALAEMQQAEFSSDTSDDALPGVPYDKGIFPADCMQFQECLPARSVSELKVGSYYEVSVAEVLDPSHFWFQQLGEHYSDTMNSIMDEMTEYFTKGPGRDGSMQQGAVQVGQYCAAPFGAEGYHRSIIVKMLSKELVKVRHVDYGTVAVVQQRALRPLRRDWAKLPAQAFRGRLYRLRPANNTNWSHSAAERFLQLVYNAKLIAEIVAVDNEEQIVDIILADTSTKQDKFINDTLVHEKFGIVGEINPKILEPFLRPSFDDLENGRAMNYDTRLKLLNNNLEPELFDEYGGGRIPESTSVTQEARGKLNRTREIERLDHGERDTAHSVCKDTIVDSDPEEHYEFYGNYECQYDSKEEVDASLIDYSGSETKETILVRSDIDHTLSDLSFNKIPLELPATRSTVPLDMTALSLNEQHLPHHTGQHQVESLSINSLNNDARSQNINFVTPLSNGPYPNQNILPWTNIPVYPQSLNNVSNIPMFTNPSPPVSLFFPPQSQQVYNLACSTSNVSQQHQNTLYPMNPQAFNVANHSLNGSQHNMASNFASRDPTQPQKFVVAPGTVSQQNLPCNIVPSKHLTASHISLNDIIKPRSDNQYASSQSNIASVRPHVPNQLPHSASSSNNSTAPPNSNTSPAKSISAKTASTHQRSEPPMTPIALSFAQIDLDIFKTVSMCDPSLANQIIIKKIKTRDGEQPDPPGLDQTPTTVITLLPIEMGIFSRLADQDPTMANDMIKEKIDYHMNHQN